VPQQKLLPDLRGELAKGNVLAVVGTGVSIQASGNAPCASWKGLILDGIEHCVQTNLMTDDEATTLREKLSTNAVLNMIEVGETISATLGAPHGGEFRRWLWESVGQLPLIDREIIETIYDLGAQIATTNYDDFLSRGRGISALPWTDVALAHQAIRDDLKGVVLHLHGHYLDPESVILSVKSYERLLASHGAQAILRALVANKTLLFIGCGEDLSDPNFSFLLEWLSEAFGTSIYRHYCLCRTSERAALQTRFPRDARLFYIEYGNDYADLAPFLRRELVPFAPSKSASSTLPAAGYCIGRDAEVEEVVATLLADKPQPLPILGGPGMGKTTIALTALHDKRVATRFGVRRWFVRCDGVKTRQELVAAIAQAMGVPISAEVETAVFAELAAKPSAVLIDNGEIPLDAGGDDVVELIANLASIESLALIVTIRAQNRPGGIPWRSTMEAERLDSPDAREVFVMVAGRPQFANDPDLDNLLKALDGMALAITLMARYAETYDTLKPVWMSWQAKHTAMLREGDGRLANLNTSFDLSMAVLSSEARRLLSVLTVLPDGIAAIDLPSVFDEPEEAAHELRNRALIFEDAKRLRMLAPLREYVAAAHPVSDGDKLRALDYYVRFVESESEKARSDRDQARLLYEQALQLYRTIPPSPSLTSAKVASPQLRVFLCHASHDKTTVRRLYEELNDLPVDPWFDEVKLLPGQDWEHEIRQALRASHVVLVCLSPKAVTKEGFVQKEIKITLDIADEKPAGTIFVIPARLEECEVPERLRRWQWVDLHVTDGMRLLVAALRCRAQELTIPWPS